MKCVHAHTNLYIKVNHFCICVYNMQNSPTKDFIWYSHYMNYDQTAKDLRKINNYELKLFIFSKKKKKIIIWILWTNLSYSFTFKKVYEHSTSLPFPHHISNVDSSKFKNIFCSSPIYLKGLLSFVSWLRHCSTTLDVHWFTLLCWYAFPPMAPSTACNTQVSDTQREKMEKTTAFYLLNHSVDKSEYFVLFQDSKSLKWEQAEYKWVGLI